MCQCLSTSDWESSVAIRCLSIYLPALYYHLSFFQVFQCFKVCLVCISLWFLCNISWYHLLFTCLFSSSRLLRSAFFLRLIFTCALKFFSDQFAFHIFTFIYLPNFSTLFHYLFCNCFLYLWLSFSSSNLLLIFSLLCSPYSFISPLVLKSFSSPVIAILLQQSTIKLFITIFALSLFFFLWRFNDFFACPQVSQVRWAYSLAIPGDLRSGE